MEKAEAKSAVKALYLQAAALAGLEVGPNSPEHLSGIVDRSFTKVAAKRRPETVANLLRLLAATIESAQKRGVGLWAQLAITDVLSKGSEIKPTSAWDRKITVPFQMQISTFLVGILVLTAYGFLRLFG